MENQTQNQNKESTASLELPSGGQAVAPPPGIIFLNLPKPRSTFKDERRALTKLVKSFLSLRHEGKLSDDDVTELVAYVCSIYIEKEVEDRVTSELNKILTRKTQSFFFEID